MAQFAGIAVDWWVLAFTGREWYYFNHASRWTLFDGQLANCAPACQGALFNLPPTLVLQISNLPAGTYNFWFAVDYPPDGVLDPASSILYAGISVTVQ